MKKRLNKAATAALSAPIRFYRRFITPLTPPSCRFTPTCSQYALEAISLHGPVKGGALALKRIGRCHPWGGQGYDPVPIDSPALEEFTDIHSHTNQGPRILTSIEPWDTMLTEIGQAWYSVGIHPWATAEPIDEATWAELERQARDQRVLAIGEAGLDALRGGDDSVQEAALRRQIALSERLGKPMIIHCVKRYNRLIELRKELRPKQRWIIHGFRGKPELARQLIAAGMDISIGEKFNPAVLDVVPAGRLFHETD